MSTIKIGDVVRLRSGGPRMTVEKIDTSALCSWFIGDHPQTRSFAIEALQLWKDGVSDRMPAGLSGPENN